MATEQPLVIDAPEPPATPKPDNVSNEPPAEFVPGGTEAQTGKKARQKKERGEFDLLGDIQEAFRNMPSDAARRRSWEWITGWLAEQYPHPLSIINHTSGGGVPEDTIARLMSGYDRPGE